MIASFKDADAQELYETGRSRRIPANIQRVASRKLKYMNQVADLNDLRMPPANNLEALSGDRKGQYSIRINDRYRICFVWKDAQCGEVEIVDYH
jgi:proteic killer suppression protein